MNILLVEPFYTGSHRAWAEGYRDRSRHEVRTLSLSGHYWKWRMHGGAVTLARRFLADGGPRPELILASDMLDLTTFLALTRPRSDGIPTAVYFHENQLMYPWSPDDRDVRRDRNHHYTFINFVSALAADRVFFNSAYHREGFLTALEKHLRGYPDHQETGSVARLWEKSAVLPLGLDLEPLLTAEPVRREGPALLVWNHRWEHDKNPEDFFAALFALADAGLPFEVAVLGERYHREPPVFAQARQRLGERVVQWGYAEDAGSYRRWLREGDLLPVTSRHDFFGASVVEGIAAGMWPLLPRRLAYPEHVQDAACFYDDQDDLVARLTERITNLDTTRQRSFAGEVARYDWSRLVTVYDDALDEAAERRGER